MAQQNNDTAEILKRYYAAEPKFHVVPVPATVDRAAAAKFIRQRVNPDLPALKMMKLAELAMFHELRETAGDFMQVLKKRETDGASYARSGWALIALAWVADERQDREARAYYQGLLLRASVQRDREMMLMVCDALGPKDDTSRLKQWLQKEIDRLDREAQEAETGGSEDRAANLRAERSNVSEFLKFRVADVDAANEFRARLAKVTDPRAQIPPLTEMYLRVGQGFTVPLENWAGLRLVHLGHSQTALTPNIGDAFIQLARRFAAPDPKNQRLQDKRRARCLRAADFFGRTPQGDDAKWLAEQEDDGTDMIALRPDWKYPAPVGPDEP